MDLLTLVTSAYVAAFRSAQASLTPYGLGFAAFFGLIAWWKTHGLELMRGSHFSGDALASTLLLALKLGLIVGILQFGLAFAEACWQSAIFMGSAAGGTNGAVIATADAPANVLTIGFAVAQPIANYLSTFSNWLSARNLAQSLLLLLSYIGIIAAFALIAFEMLFALVSFYMALLTCTVAIGFVLVSGVSHFAETALGWISGVLIGAFVLSAFLGVGLPLFGEVQKLITPTLAPGQLFAPVPETIIEAKQAIGALVISWMFALMAILFPVAAGVLGGRGIAHAVNAGRVGSLAGSFIPRGGGIATSPSSARQSLARQS